MTKTGWLDGRPGEMRFDKLNATRCDSVNLTWQAVVNEFHRPERPEFIQELEKQIPYYSIRHSVRPGISGWAQVIYW